MTRADHFVSLLYPITSNLFVCALLVLTPSTQAANTVRLVNNIGKESHKGRVEVFYADAWGTICDDNWDIVDADVVCRQLGYTGAVQALKKAYFGAGTNLIWMDEVNCKGHESRIQDCAHNGWGVHDCVHIEDAGVECSTATVRMLEGPDRYEGNVQLLHNNEWGYVCDDDWDYADAKVACDQLDNRDIDAVRVSSYYGTQSGTIWMNNMKCNGTEKTLQDCANSGWGNTGNCSINDKAGVMCTKDPIEDGAVRLVGTSDPYRGRVEIYHDGQWGTVCDDFWDYYDAKVVCRQLGYTDSQPKAYVRAYFGAGSGPIWKDNVACYGSESRLDNCPTPYGWGQHDCTHAEDAGVYCDLRGVYDAGEITGIVIASLIGFGIFMCCVKFIFCEAVNNKSESRRSRNRRRRRNRSTTNNTTTPTDPEEHFNAHFNTAYTISDNQEEIFTPPGFPFAPPFPAAQPGNGELPPAYDAIFAKGGPSGDGAEAAAGGATGGANPIDTGAVNTNPAGADFGAGAVASGSSNPYPPQARKTSEHSTHGQPPSSASPSFIPVENPNDASAVPSSPPPYEPVQQGLPYPPANPFPVIPSDPNASQSQAQPSASDEATDSTGAAAEPVRANPELASASVVQSSANAEPTGAAAEPVDITVNIASATEDPAIAPEETIVAASDEVTINERNEENCDSDA